MCLINHSFAHFLPLYLHLCVCISGEINAENVRSKNLQREMDSMINDLQNVLWLFCRACLCDVSFQFLFLRFYHYYYYCYYYYYFVCVYIDWSIVWIVSECFLLGYVFFENWEENIEGNFFCYRRITCRKGEVQGCQRRTRHDIERIVGLLSNEINLVWWWRQQQQEAFLFFFFLYNFPLLFMIPLLPVCEFRYG